MALIKCRECHKEISSLAASCPACGAPVAIDNQSVKYVEPPTERQGTSRLKVVAIVLAFVLAVVIAGKTVQKDLSDGESVAANPPGNHSEVLTATPSASSGCGCATTKKDGTLDHRSCDLDELSKDWVFYGRKIRESAAHGDESAAQAARQSFQQINDWLGAYKEDDVSGCITKQGGR